MKFETTPAFDSDYRRLKCEHAAAFKKIVPEKFAPACDAYAHGDDLVLRQSRRARYLRAGQIDGGLRCRWRRVGDHDVFKKP